MLTRIKINEADEHETCVFSSCDIQCAMMNLPGGNTPVLIHSLALTSEGYAAGKRAVCGMEAE